uniref:Uncharacterized protein n=1 Tax=Arundo donax TaxID=35708 RepID=A0A0A9HUS0_ARUDO
MPRAISVQFRAPSFSTRLLRTASSSGDHGPLTLSSIAAFAAASAAAAPPTVNAPEVAAPSSSSPEGGGDES